MSAPTVPSSAVPAVAPPPRVSARRRAARRAFRLAANLTLLVAVVALLALGVGPRVVEYRTITMLTGSMSPGIDPGDMIVITPVPAAEVRPGMVITYQSPLEDRRVVTHRVVEVAPGPNGAVAVRTKGDNNAEVDPWVATLREDAAWQVRKVVPGVGAAIRALRQPAVHAALLWGVPVLLTAWGLVSIWRPARRDEQP